MAPNNYGNDNLSRFYPIWYVEQTTAPQQAPEVANYPVTSYKVTPEEDRAIRDWVGPYRWLELDHRRDGYNIIFLDGNCAFVSRAELGDEVYRRRQTLKMATMSQRIHDPDTYRSPLQNWRTKHGLDGDTPNNEMCPSCKSPHDKATIMYDHLNRCDKTIKLFWRKVHNLYWYRYIKNKVT